MLSPSVGHVQNAMKLSTQDYIDIQELTGGYPYKVDKCTNSGYDYADQYTADGIFGVSSAWGSAGKIWYRGREELADAGGGGKDGCRNRGAASGAGRVHHITTSFVITPTPTGASGRSTLLSLGNGDGTTPPKIEWQGGYADFSVSQSNLEQVQKYIAGQEKHHRKMGYQDEYRELLRQHGLKWDEKYLWD